MPHLLSIIVPVYNEAATIRQVVDRLLAVPLPVDREIIIVDDGSTDGTRTVLEQMPRHSDRVHLIRVPQNLGKGHAVRVGLARARGTIVAIQDADLELDPAELAHLVAPILDGRCHVVYGSRFLNGRPDAPWATIAANWFLTALTNRLFHTRLTDMETCYKILAGDVARALPLESARFEIEPEITARLLRRGYEIVERPVRFEPRRRGQGKKIGWRDGLRAIAALLKYRFRA